MKLRHAVLVAALALCVMSGLEARGQQIKNSCVKQFYDSKSWNWLTFRNTCDEPIYLVWIGGQLGVNGAAEIGPGRTAGTGWSGEEIRSHGGIEIYACRKGYMPVDPQGNLIVGNDRPAYFRCEVR